MTRMRAYTPQDAAVMKQKAEALKATDPLGAQKLLQQADAILKGINGLGPPQYPPEPTNIGYTRPNPPSSPYASTSPTIRDATEQRNRALAAQKGQPAITPYNPPKTLPNEGWTPGSGMVNSNDPYQPKSDVRAPVGNDRAGPYGNDNVVGRVNPPASGYSPYTGSSPSLRKAFQMRDAATGANGARQGFSHGGQVRRYDEGGMVSAGQRLQNMKMAIRPANYNAFMQPGSSARDMTSAMVSQLGAPPVDFWADLERGFAQGVDPNTGVTAGFSAGGQAQVRGKVKVKKGADGSFEYSEG